MPSECYCRQLRTLLLCLCDVFQALINSPECLFCLHTVCVPECVLKVNGHWRPELCMALRFQRHMRQMLEAAEEHKKKKLRTQLISEIYHAPTEDAAQKCIKLIALEKGKCWYVSLLKCLHFCSLS